MKDCLFCPDYVPDALDLAVRLAGLMRCEAHEGDAEALLDAVRKARWRDGPRIPSAWWATIRAAKRSRQNNWRIFKS